MIIEFSKDEVDLILDLIRNGQHNIRNATGTPYEVQQLNLAKLDSLALQIRTVRAASDD